MVSRSADRQFTLPEDRRAPWWVWAVAAALQVPMAWLLVTHVRQREIDGESALLHRTDITIERPQQVKMPFDRTRKAKPPSIRATAPPIVVATPSPLPQSAGAPASVPTSIPAAGTSVPVALSIAPVDTGSAPADARPHIGPRFASGVLWSHPSALLGDAPPRDTTRKTLAQVADSNIAVAVQQWLDQMAEERAQAGPPLPSWTTKIGGKTVGIDQKWIYLGPIKVPTALLAFLPINYQSNPTTAEFNKKLSVMRADLFEAARRSATYTDFRNNVNAMNAEEKRKRDFKKNQLTPPPAGGGGGE